MRDGAPPRILSGDADDQIRDTLVDAMRTVAREDPAALDSLVGGGTTRGE